MVIGFQGDSLALQSDFQQRIFAHQIENFIRHFLDDARARVVVLVNAMAKAHQLGFAGLHALDEFGNSLDRADFHEHAQHFFIRAAV
jgi:hypothetical protein